MLSRDGSCQGKNYANAAIGFPELPSLQGITARYPLPSCGACPVPANATQRRAPPGSGALWRGHRGPLGGTEEPCARGETGGGGWGGRRRRGGTKIPFEIPIRVGDAIPNPLYRFPRPSGWGSIEAASSWSMASTLVISQCSK